MRNKKNVSLEEKNKLTKMNVIRSRAQNIYTEIMNKVALSCEDGIHTFDHGHFKYSAKGHEFETHTDQISLFMWITFCFQVVCVS